MTQHGIRGLFLASIKGVMRTIALAFALALALGSGGAAALAKNPPGQKGTNGNQALVRTNLPVRSTVAPTDHSPHFNQSSTVRPARSEEMHSLANRSFSTLSNRSFSNRVLSKGTPLRSRTPRPLIQAPSAMRSLGLQLDLESMREGLLR